MNEREWIRRNCGPTFLPITVVGSASESASLSASKARRDLSRIRVGDFLLQEADWRRCAVFEIWRKTGRGLYRSARSLYVNKWCYRDQIWQKNADLFLIASTLIFSGFASSLGAWPATRSACRGMMSSKGFCTTSNTIWAQKKESTRNRSKKK